MSKRLSRDEIIRWVGTDKTGITRRRSGGGSGAGGGGGVSSQWVDEHYVSKEFFARLFTINGTDENDEDVIVEPNDLDTTIKNIQMMVGAWTEQYLSALGLSDGGGGGGGATALSDLVDVQYVGTPSAGQILKYNGTKWYNADDGGGTVQDVTLAMPAGFDVQKTTNQGTIALTVSLDRGEGASALGNKLFLATPVAGSCAPSWRAITADDVDFSNYTFWGQHISNGVVTGSITVGNGYIILNNDKSIYSYNAPAEGETAATIEMMRLRSNNSARLFYGAAQAGYTTLVCGNAIGFRYGDGSTNAMVITQTGLITMGTSGTSSFVTEKLNVNGNIRTATSNGSYIQIGNVRLIYDSTNTALKVEKSDGTAAGLYATGFLSALGANSQQGGGGSSTLAGLNDVQITSPTPGQTLVYRGTHWVNESVGTVTSVDGAAASGSNLTVTGGPITSSGTLTIGVASNYSIPKTSKQTNWDFAYTWVNTNGASTVNKTAWGQTYWSAGAPQTISGNMSSVGNITFSESGKNIGGMMYFNTTDSQIKLASNATTITYTTDGTNALIPALYASGSIYTTGSFVMDNGKSFVCKDTGNVARSVIGVNSSNRLRIGYGHATGGNDHWTLIYGGLIAMYYGTSRTLGAILDGSGNVGIGTSSPEAKLDVNGQLKASAYLSCHNAEGTYRTAGWVKVATIDITAASPSQPLKFRVTQRLRVGGELTVLFSHSSTAAETSVSEFFYTGDIVGAILVGGGSSYSLYIKKVGGTDRIGISLVDIGSYMNGRMTVTWEDAQYTETGDPVGTVASCRYYFASNVYMEYNATNEGIHVVNAGLYTDTYVSALGANSSGGGGSTTLLPPLDAINNLGIPAQYNSVIMYTSSGWKYQTINGSGTVTRVAMNVPAGFTIGVGSAGSGTTSPDITQSGTFYLGFGTTTANRVLGTDSNGAVSWRELAAGDIPDLSSTYATSGRVTTLEGYFNSNGVAKSAAKLTTTSKTAWGQTYWTSGGVPTSISGDMSSVGDISMSGSITGCTDIDSILNFDTTNSRVGVGASSPSTRLHVKGRITAEYDSTYSGSFQAIRGNYVTQFGINSSGYALIATGQNGSSSPTVRLSFTPYTEMTDPHILTGTSSLKIGTDGTNFYDGKYMQIGAVRMAYNASNTLKVIKADNTTANLEVSGRAIVNSIDLMGENDSGTYYSYLDFHYNGSTADYTTRLIETANAELSIRSNSGSTKTGLVVGRAVDGDYVKIGDIYIGYDSANDALEVYKVSGNSHASANLYARGAVSALGQGGSGSGGGIDLNTMWNALENNASGHSIGTSTNGLNALYATSIYANGVQVLTSSNGVTIATAQTISGAKTFSGNLLAKKIQMTASNAATYLEHTKLYSPNATMTIQGSDSTHNLTLCTGGGNVSIGTAADANYRLKVSGSSLFDGNVGIGGYNSSYKLYVSGTTCTSSLKVNSTYEFVVNWDNDEFFEVGAYNREIHAIGSWYGSWRGASDIRKKNVVSKVDVDVAQIAELPIFNFTWKNSTDKDTYLGTSAQEVKKLFPSAVSVMSDGMLGMAYGETALAAAVMTARKVVDHEARIKRMEKEIELLKAMKA